MDTRWLLKHLWSLEAVIRGRRLRQGLVQSGKRIGGIAEC